MSIVSEIKSECSIKANILIEHVSINSRYSAVRKSVVLNLENDSNVPYFVKEGFNNSLSQFIVLTDNLHKALDGSQGFEPAKVSLLTPNYINAYKKVGLDLISHIIDESEVAECSEASKFPFDYVVNNPNKYLVGEVKFNYGFIYVDDEIVLPGIHFGYMNYGANILESEFSMDKVKECLSHMEGINYWDTSRNYVFNLKSEYFVSSVPGYQDNGGEGYISMIVELSDPEVISIVKDKLKKEKYGSPSVIARILMDIDYFGLDKAGARRIPPNQ